MLIGATDRNSSQAKKPPVLMSAFDEHRTALSQSQQLYQGKITAVRMRKEPELQRAGSQLGWGTGAAQMASEVPAMAQAKPQSSVHVAVESQSSAGCLKEPGGHCSISCSYSMNSYCQQPPSSLGWGTEKHFYPQQKHKITRKHRLGKTSTWNHKMM